jgi:kynurenine 3-monooxygenase
MNAGFEDCSELVRLLEESDHDWAMTLPQFTEQRKPNADAIAQMAIENYTTMRSSVADEKFQLKKEVGFELERRFPDLFIPRYSLVMFHRVPYAVAKEQGERQAKLLDVLTQKVHSIEQVDMELAERLVRNQFDSNTGD